MSAKILLNFTPISARLFSCFLRFYSFISPSPTGDPHHPHQREGRVVSAQRGGLQRGRELGGIPGEKKYLYFLTVFLKAAIKTRLFGKKFGNTRAQKGNFNLSYIFFIYKGKLIGIFLGGGCDILLAQKTSFSPKKHNQFGFSFQVEYREISDYHASLGSLGQSSPRVELRGASRSRIILEDLAIGKSYEVVVRPYNGQGAGPASR